MKKWLVLLLSLFCGAAAAAEIAVQDTEVRVSGMLFEPDAEQFRAVLRENPRLTRVVFDKCLGGTLGAALDFATLIRAHRLATVASRQASSACAMAFLAGHDRRFDDSVPLTSIVLHAGRKRDGSGPSSDIVNRRILLYLETATDGKLAPHLLRLVEWSWSEAAGVIFIRRTEGAVKSDEVRYCDGTQGPELSQCRPLAGYDPLSQGIVTSR